LAGRSKGPCCPAFQSRLDEAGQRGAAVLVAAGPGEKPVFILQHRAVDIGKEQSVQTEAPLSLVSELRIRHCPWCGRSLQEWYADHWRTFVNPAVPAIAIPELDR